MAGFWMVRKAQQRMQQVLDGIVREGAERGLQLVAYLNGELVVDVWAGVADAATGRSVDGQTLFPVFSVTKGMAATLAHLLVERGELTYDTPIAELWPEFAAHGKQGITVRHALSHAAGLPYMPMGIGVSHLCDWDAMCQAMAELRPAWPAGTQMVYHAVTFSWLVGEVVRRVAGRPFGQVLEEEICRPLAIDGMFAGIPDEAESRVAVLEEVFESGQAPAVDDTVPRDVPGWMQPLHEWMNRPDVRRACIPASNGIMSARAIARHYAALLPGGVDGVELLPPSRIRQATQLQRPSDPPAAGAAMSMSLGYFLGVGSAEMGGGLSMFGHGGYGGSLGFADPERRLAVGLTKNRFSRDGAGARILQELRNALDVA